MFSQDDVRQFVAFGTGPLVTKKFLKSESFTDKMLRPHQRLYILVGGPGAEVARKEINEAIAEKREWGPVKTSASESQDGSIIKLEGPQRAIVEVAELLKKRGFTWLTNDERIRYESFGTIKPLDLEK